MNENEKIDLKEEETTPAGGDQPAESKTEELSVEDLQKQLADEKEAREKAERDRDNYREGMLSAKSKETIFPDDEKEEVLQKKIVEPEYQPEEEKRYLTKDEYAAESKKTIMSNQKVAIKKWITKNS